jgi:hypothetical protein
MAKSPYAFVRDALRKSFEVGDEPTWDVVYLALRADDGAAVFLNGHEVVRLRLPDGRLTPETLANTVVSDGMEAEYSIHRIPVSLLRRGRNVLAVEVHQAEANSSDVLFDLELVTFDKSLVRQALRRLYQTFRPDETLAAIRRDWTFSLPDPPADWRERVQTRLLAAAAAATRK